METIKLAHILRDKAQVALIESQVAREQYVLGIREKCPEDELRHRHYAAMDAASKAEKAAHMMMGERKVTYYRE